MRRQRPERQLALTLDDMVREGAQRLVVGLKADFWAADDDDDVDDLLLHPGSRFLRRSRRLCA